MLMSKTNDKKWEELNKALLEAMKRGDFDQMSQQYNDMAFLLAEEGKDARRLLQERNKCTLLNFKELKIEKAEISSARDEHVCKYCSSLEGKILPIDEALSTMPIPGKCTHKEWISRKMITCRCLYLPVIKV